MRLLVLLLAALQLPAQVLRPLDVSTDTGSGRLASSRSSTGSQPPGAMIGAQDKVFARIMCGNGWDTAIMLLNMGPGSLRYHQFFIAPDGTPMPVTFSPSPDSQLLTAAAVEGSLNENSSFSLKLCDSSGPFQEGWSVLSYDETQGRIGGYAVIRHRSRSGGFSFEATVPLSNMQDFALYMPFDNTQGFRTHLTLVNPAVNLAAQVRLTYLSPDGGLLLIDSLIMKPGQQTTIVLPDTYPDLANKIGTVVAEANINRFSAVGLRYNDLSGAISAIPPMNWSGMF